MDEAWKQLPRAAVIVWASVLAVGAERSAQAERPNPGNDPGLSVELAQPGPNKAPTCGSACHGGGGEEAVMAPLPRDEDIRQTAPTCGEACHGGYEPPNPNNNNNAPPPVEPSKKGCAVEDVDEDSPLGLALLGTLGVGLLAGVAGRRRRESVDEDDASP